MMGKQALQLLLAGIHADLQAYDALTSLLERQFASVLQHATVQLADIGDEITATCAALEARRSERVSLVDALLPRIDAPAAERMEQVLRQLPQPYREAAEKAWTMLGERIRHCKALNERNCGQLLVQHELMMQVLAPQGETYAPR
jgi:flagella synthesis protein FlgN